MPLVKHKFISAISDIADPTQVRPSNWNDTHAFTFQVNSISANTTLDATYDIVLGTAGAGGITVTLPTAVGFSGGAYYIKKVDSAAGNVTIATTSSQTIDGGATYLLVNQYQFVIVVSDNANWQIVGKS
jgi:hypothetical protein